MMPVSLDFGDEQVVTAASTSSQTLQPVAMNAPAHAHAPPTLPGNGPATKLSTSFTFTAPPLPAPAPSSSGFSFVYTPSKDVLAEKSVFGAQMGEDAVGKVEEAAVIEKPESQLLRLPPVILLQIFRIADNSLTDLFPLLCLNKQLYPIILEVLETWVHLTSLHHLVLFSEHVRKHPEVADRVQTFDVMDEDFESPAGVAAMVMSLLGRFQQLKAFYMLLDPLKLFPPFSRHLVDLPFVHLSSVIVSMSSAHLAELVFQPERPAGAKRFVSDRLRSLGLRMGMDTDTGEFREGPSPSLIALPPSLVSLELYEINFGGVAGLFLRLLCNLPNLVALSLDRNKNMPLATVVASGLEAVSKHLRVLKVRRPEPDEEGEEDESGDHNWLDAHSLSLLQSLRILSVSEALIANAGLKKLPRSLRALDMRESVGGDFHMSHRMLLLVQYPTLKYVSFTGAFCACDSDNLERMMELTGKKPFAKARLDPSLYYLFGHMLDWVDEDGSG